MKYRLYLVLSCVALGLVSNAGAPAQEDGAGPGLQEIVVTGSRIAQTDLVTSSPVIRVDSEELLFQGTVRVEDLLRTLPQLYVRQGAGQSNGATGTATVDLRNLEPERTLTLINGRRMPAGSPLQGGIGADINQVPGALIESVEVLTGGASATYGSDAIAGVVNFRLVDDFEGVRVNYQFSRYNHDNDSNKWQDIVTDAGYPVATGSSSGGDASDLSLIAGRNFAAGRGNISAYATYRDINKVLQADRDYSSCALNNDLSGCFGSFTIPQGRFSNFGVGGPFFDYMVEGDRFVPSEGEAFNYGPYNYFQRPDERYTFGGFARYEVNSLVEAYAELMYMDDRSVSQIAPSGAFFVTNTLNCGNAFMSEQQYETLCGRFGLGRDDAQTVYLGRRNVEGGNRRHDVRHKSLRGVFGLRGEFNDQWRYDAYLQYAEVNMDGNYLNDLSISRIGKALDAVRDADGNIVCRSSLDGTDPDCVPWNVFSSGAVTREMLDYLTLPLTSEGDTDQFVASAYVAGSLEEYGVKSPLAVNGAELVAGAEYREQNLNYDPDEAYRSGDGAGQGGASKPVSGGYKVLDFFLEGSIPLVEGARAAEEVILDLGYRYSDYDYGETTHTFAVRGGWALDGQAKLRGSFQRAVRGPNVRELFLPQGFNLFDMTTDPCGGPVADGLTAAGRSLEECARSGVTAGQFGNISHSPAGQYNFLQGGNPELAPEEANTWSVGLILTPYFADNLSLTLDYYSIRIKEGISRLTPEFILNQCLDGNLSQCELVRRGRSGDLWLGSDLDASGHIVALQDNLAIERVKGYDAVLDYNLDLGRWGGLRLNNVLAYVESWDQQELAGVAAEACAGNWGATCGYPRPDLKNSLRLTWTLPWPVSASVKWRHIGGVRSLNSERIHLRKVDYLDLAAYWDVSERIMLRAGVNNLFDVAPPVAGGAAGPSIEGNGNIFPGVYDALGRYWFAGVSVGM